MSVFVDSSAFLAVLNADDRFHAGAVQIWRDLIEAQTPLFSSNYVLLETVAILQNRLGMEAVTVFHNDILPLLTVLWIDEDLHRRAIGAMLAAQRRRLSLVDCASFECMRQASLQQAFTFDAHFAEQGFEILL